MTAAGEDTRTESAESSPQETLQSGAPDAGATASPSKTPRQEEAGAATLTPDTDEQPTQPRVAEAPKRPDAPSAPQAPEPPVPVAPPEPAAQPQSDPQPPASETPLADLDWMPPAEDRVARFLNDVADIAPLPTRDREGIGASFMLASAVSPEEAERKKARAEPFWSQVVAAPMEGRASAPSSPRARRITRKRRRRRARWFALVSASVVLVVIGLAVVALTHPELLHLK
ncbi:MAG TPA: hypothetical protein VH599_17635 [Ktedonobacterales bacterium]